MLTEFIPWMQGPNTGWLRLVTLKVIFDAKVLARFNSRDVGILLRNCNGTVLVVKSAVCLSLMKNGEMKTMALFKAYVFAKALGLRNVIFRVIVNL